MKAREFMNALWRFGWKQGWPHFCMGVCLLVGAFW